MSEIVKLREKNNGNPWYIEMVKEPLNKTLKYKKKMYKAKIFITEDKTINRVRK